MYARLLPTPRALCRLSYTPTEPQLLALQAAVLQALPAMTPQGLSMAVFGLGLLHTNGVMRAAADPPPPHPSASDAEAPAEPRDDRGGGGGDGGGALRAGWVRAGRRGQALLSAAQQQELGAAIMAKVRGGCLVHAGTRGAVPCGRAAARRQRRGFVAGPQHASQGLAGAGPPTHGCCFALPPLASSY